MPHIPNPAGRRFHAHALWFAVVVVAGGILTWVACSEVSSPPYRACAAPPLLPGSWPHDPTRTAGPGGSLATYPAGPANPAHGPSLLVMPISLARPAAELTMATAGRVLACERPPPT